MAETNGILSPGFQKVVVFDTKKNEEIAVITPLEVITANEDIIVKLTPGY